MIKSLLKGITPDERKELQIAFEAGRTHYLHLPPDEDIGQNKILGVHPVDGCGYRIIEQAGFWFYGELT